MRMGLHGMAAASFGQHSAFIVYPYTPLYVCHVAAAGIMVYGNGYFGVTEANYAVVALHLWGFLMG